MMKKQRLKTETMRKILSLSTLMIALAPTLFSQEKRELDWQNFKTSVTKSQLAVPVKWGQFTIFQIININKFLYKVEIVGRVFELQTPIPSELQTLFRLSPSDLQKTTTNAKTQQAIAQSTEGLTAVKKAIDEKVSERAGTGDTQGPFEAALADLQTNYQTYLDQVKHVSNDVLALKRTRNQLISIAQKDISFSKMQDELTAVQWPIMDIETHYNDLKELYDVVNEKAAVAKSAANDDASKALVDAISTKLRNADALIEQESLLSIIDDVDYLYTELNNQNNFVINAPPVQMDGDLISYGVKITPSATKALAPYRNPMEFKFDVPAKGGLKVDFSVGPAVSVGKGAKDALYFLQKTTSADTVTLKRRKNNNSISPGIGAFMHFYPHSGNYATVGAMFGVGVGFQNTSDVNLSLYFGLSAVLGKTQKIMISSGFSYLKVKRIKDGQFTEDTKYPTSSADLSQVTEAVFRPSVFFSISYNLTNRIEVTK